MQRGGACGGPTAKGHVEVFESNGNVAMSGFWWWLHDCIAKVIKLCSKINDLLYVNDASVKQTKQTYQSRTSMKGGLSVC